MRTSGGCQKAPARFFPVLEVNGHLPPHGGVHLGEEGGGDLDEVHPPEDGGGGEARQISHHAAPQGNHGVGAGEAEGHHLLPQDGELPGGLGGLPGGDGDQEGLKARLGEAVQHPLSVERAHRGIGDHEEPPGPGVGRPGCAHRPRSSRPPAISMSYARRAGPPSGSSWAFPPQPCWVSHCRRLVTFRIRASNLAGVRGLLSVAFGVGAGRCGPL